MSSPRKRGSKLLLLIPAFAGMTICSAFALSVPDRPAGYVNDYAGLLSASARQNLESTLAGFDRDTSNQIFIATFPLLEGQVMEDFSIKLFDRWKPGTKKNDNGVLILIFRDDRKMRIEVGYGLEGALPDALCKQIIQNEMVPSFRAGDFDKGMAQAVSAVMQATRGEYQPAPRAEETLEKYKAYFFVGLVLYVLVPIICYIFVIGLFVWFMGPVGFGVGLAVVLFLIVLRAIVSSPFAGRTFSSRGGSWGGDGFSSGGFGGGFSAGGGGGMGGGGGASGRW